MCDPNQQTVNVGLTKRQARIVYHALRNEVIRLEYEKSHSGIDEFSKLLLEVTLTDLEAACESVYFDSGIGEEMTT